MRTSIVEAMMKLAPHLTSGSSAARPRPPAADEAAGGSGGGDGGIRGTAVTVGAWGRKLTDSPVSHTILVSPRACQLLQSAGLKLVQFIRFKVGELS